MKSDYMEDAACKGRPLEWWFPEGDTLEKRAAHNLCDLCPVARKCYEFAVECNVKHGIWGGVDFTNETKVLRRKVSNGREECV